MSISEKKAEPSLNVASVEDYPTPARNADDTILAELGYKAEFRREFSVSRSMHTCDVNAHFLSS